jgi:hypothetical protein
MLESRPVHTPSSIELLRGLGRKETDLILAAAKRRRFHAKSVMTYQGEPADHLLLLWKGRARYFFESQREKAHSDVDYTRQYFWWSSDGIPTIYLYREHRGSQIESASSDSNITFGRQSQ